MKDYSVIDGMCRDFADKTKTCFDKGYKQGYEDGIGDGAKSVESWDKACYEQGLNDAWEAAKWIFNASVDDMMQTFGGVSLWVNYTASEAIAKIKEYEDKQTDDEIRVGDEIVLKKDIEYRPIVITKIKDDNELFGVTRDGGIYGWIRKDEAKKTGRHFDQIEEVLKQMQEDKG